MQKAVIDFLVASAERAPAVKAMKLFGSRARGDAQERSDYDVAVWADAMTDGEWARWSLDVAEEVPTLCGIDLVRVTTDLDQKLLEAINREGVSIYAKDPT